jgi:hypothetical protein
LLIPVRGPAGKPAHGFQKRQQVARYRGKRRLFHPQMLFGNHNNIRLKRQQSLVPAEKFPQYPLDAIARACGADFFAHSQPHSPFGRIIPPVARKQDEVL